MEAGHGAAGTTAWALRGRAFAFPRAPVVMGVLNVTPDSFSDGGSFLDPGRALDAALAMSSDGAEVIDVGGESTRPGAADVAEAEEIRRVVPVVARLRAASPVAISVDTRKPAVARAALDAGADAVNDIGAAWSENAMWGLLRDTGAGYVCMHMQGVPATMQSDPRYDDVVAEVGAFLRGRLAALAAAGVDPSRVVLDPGIGFGKTPAHNLALLRGLGSLVALGRPVLVGVSRKSFLGHLAGGGPLERLPAAIACTLDAARRGAAIFRTHDVRGTVQALRMHALLGEAAP